MIRGGGFTPSPRPTPSPKSTIEPSPNPKAALTSSPKPAAEASQTTKTVPMPSPNPAAEPRPSSVTFSEGNQPRESYVEFSPSAFESPTTRNQKFASAFNNNSQNASSTRVFPDSNASSFRSEISTPGGSLPVFHGTTRESAHSIREHGFQSNLKSGGATIAAGTHDPNSRTKHFFTTRASEAKQVAIHASENGALGQPAVVKANLPAEYRSQLTDDPMYSGDPGHAYMLKHDVPSHFVAETRNVKLDSNPDMNLDPNSSSRSSDREVQSQEQQQIETERRVSRIAEFCLALCSVFFRNSSVTDDATSSRH